MKIGVAGLWHLGCVTSACLAEAGYDVIAYDSNNEVIAELQQGKAPLYEPRLNELITKNIQDKKLSFSTQLEDLSNVDILWITFDTPVDDHDIADVTCVTDEIKKIFSHLKKDTVVLLSSQLPVGTTRQLQMYCSQHYPDKDITFAYSPENLRLGKAIDVFTQPDRIIVGCQNDRDKERIRHLLLPFTQNMIWMSIESAEMTKHALNAFLATSVVFINELATLCEQVGADAREVEKGLKSEERIGPKAYLRPGNAIAGGTLARDVNYLIQMGQQHIIKTPLFSALLESNQAHKQWSCRKVIATLKNLKDKTIAVLGLTYKVGTDTLRRSTAIEISEWLNQQGATVVAYDPALTQLPPEFNHFIQLKNTLTDTLKKVDAIIISTELPEFLTLTTDTLLTYVNQPFVFDASGFLAKNLGHDPRIHYFSVGRHI